MERSGKIGRLYPARARGTWTIEIHLGRDPATGKKKRKYYTVEGTKKDAQRFLTEKLQQMNSGTWADGDKITFGQYLLRWLRDYAKANVRPRTYDSYHMLVEKHIVPALGNIPLTKLTALDLQGFYTAKLADGRIGSKGKENAGLSPTTVLYMHRVIHLALGQAVKWGLLARNVADLVKPPRKARTGIKPLTPEQVDLFLEAARESRNYCLYLMAVTTGMRQGELLGLRWEDIDLQKGIARVRQTLIKPGINPIFGEPKTAKARRQIELTPTVVEALKKHKAKQNEERLLLGNEYHNHGLVFAQPNGSPIDIHHLTKREFKSLLAKAGLPDIRFHDLRHTAATILLAKGVHPKIVSELLGHATVGMTLDTYSHFLPSMQKEAVRAMEEIISEKTS